MAKDSSILKLTARHHDGTEFPVDISLSPVYDKDLSSVAVSRDLSKGVTAPW